jgi:ribosome-associated protein
MGEGWVGAFLMLEITPSLKIDERELQIDFMRASGPGGQNVNKVATAVQLRFDIHNSSLPEDVKARLIHLAGKRITSEGILLIEAKRFRTQEQNREDAIQRFIELVRKSLVKPKARKKTKPTKASQKKRLKEKKERGEIKKMRQSKDW